MTDITWLTLGMMAVTYCGRVCGYWFILFVKPSEKTQHFLKLIPGTIFIAMIAPPLLASGWIGWVAALISFFLAIRSRNLFISLLIGIAVYTVLQFIET